MARFFPAEPDERPLAADGNGLDGAVLGILAYAVLLRANSEGQSTWLQYLLFLAGIFPVSAFFALIYSRTRSVFLCVLFHGSLNAGAAHWFGPLLAGQLLPYALWIVLLWIAAIPVFRTLTRSSRVATETADLIFD